MRVFVRRSLAFPIVFATVAFACTLQGAVWIGKTDTNQEQFREFCHAKLATLPFVNSAISFEYLTATWLTKSDELSHTPQLFRITFDPNQGQAYLRGYSLRLVTDEHLRSVSNRDGFFNGDAFRKVNYVQCYLANPQYDAELEFRGSSAVVTSTKNNIKEPSQLKIHGAISDFIGQSSLRSFLDISQDNNINFVSWSDTTVSAMNAKKVIFQQQTTRGKDRLLEVTAFFAVDDGRCLEWSFADAENPELVIRRAKYEYLKNDNTIVPKSFTVEDVEQGWKTTKWFRDFKYLGNVNKDQFFLSHYDLPEPDWYTPARPYWLYLSVAGMMLLVIGAIVVRFGKKRWRCSP